MNYYGLCDNKGINIDKKLDELFNGKRDGFYIELGANDGITQSNTAFFEFNRGWTGLLIEPSLDAFLKCKSARPKSNCLNYACVSSSYHCEKILGDFNGSLMSSVNGTRLNNSNLVNTPVTTLDKVLDEYNPKPEIDLLSLDTEGYELEILKGIDLNKFRPKYMLIEVYRNEFDELRKYLSENNYSMVCNFSNYNSKDNPHWDGSHNDYLFKDNLAEK